MNPALLKKVSIVLDALTIVAFVVILVGLMNSWTVYHNGPGFLDRAFKAIFLLVLLRSITLVPWRSLARVPTSQKAFAGAAAIVFVLFMYNLVLSNFKSAAMAVVETRAAFHGATDEEIAIDITEHNKWYPRASFAMELQKAIPEDAGIAYIGDQRAHIMSYLLYPRRVYVLPELQKLLNWSIQQNWTWMPKEDPFHPQADPLHPVVEKGFENAGPDPKWQEDFNKMVKEKNIEWVVYYDSIYPDKAWFRRIEKP